MKILFCDDHPDEMAQFVMTVQEQVNILGVAAAFWMDWLDLTSENSEAVTATLRADVGDTAIEGFIVADHQMLDDAGQAWAIDPSLFDCLVCDVSWGNEENYRGLEFCRKLRQAGVSDDRLGIVAVTQRALEDFTHRIQEFDGIVVRSKTQHASEVASWIVQRYQESKTASSYLPCFGEHLNQCLLRGPVDALFHGRDYYGTRVGERWVTTRYTGGPPLEWVQQLGRAAAAALTALAATNGFPA